MEIRKEYRNFFRKPEGTLWRLRHGWEDNIDGF
jgi:hypothetical protein